MASYDELKAEMGLAIEKASESMGALQQAHSHLEEALGLMQRVSEGSAQAEVHDVNAQLAQAVSSLAEVQQLVKSAISTAEETRARQ